MEEKKYLRANVQIEPLINLWHAYPFVVAPATAAMVTANYQLTTMKSYLQMPMAHVAALKNPDMIGGPFIDYNGGRLPEIKALKEKIESDSSELLSFADAIKQLNLLLKTKAKGFPLEDLYREVPEVLRGYIELVYDLEHNASYRFLERLLYANRVLYDRTKQSIALAQIDNDKRSFIFSTPRLPDKKIVHLPFSFDDSRIDALAKLKNNGKPYSEIKEILGIDDLNDETFQSFLTTQPPHEPEKYVGPGVRVRYFGHACVLLETANVTVMTDPLISYKYDSEIERFTYEDLPAKIDYVIITHCHHDHIVLETLLQIRHKIGQIIVPRAGNGSLQDPSMKLILNNIGFQNVIEIDEMEQIQIPGGQITGLPFYGEHCDLNIRSKSTYLVSIADLSFLMVADSSSINRDVYMRVQKEVGGIDVLFVGMECTGAPMSWSYGAFFTEPLDRQLDQVRRSKGSNSDTALDLVEIFTPSYVYLYAMGAEPWLNYFMALQHSHSDATDMESAKLLEACASKGVVGKSLFAKMEMVFEPEFSKSNSQYNGAYQH
jgi:L-ascorbate metabolism protein UlaG (beta-lactamase superfamily)